MLQGAAAAVARQVGQLAQLASWLSCYRRLQMRWDRRSERLLALAVPTCALTCFRTSEVTQ
jgi:hypothetical protein